MHIHQNSMSRRSFITSSITCAAALTSVSATVSSGAETPAKRLRLGGPTFEKFDGPDAWVRVLKRLGYRAAYCPVDAAASDDTVRAYAAAAAKADIVIAETGAWSNPISRDEKTRNDALAKCRTQLTLAERIGANCCVNISGSRAELWDGPSAENFTPETFDMIVETTRAIIDDVKPKRTYFALETMPWAYPDSPESYVRLLKAIDRERFAVHLDPANLLCSPQRYYGSGRLIRRCFELLGPRIRSCHAKDIILSDRLTTHLDEIRPGLGGMDYEVFLRELSRFPETPLMLEHLPNAEQYDLAAGHIRSVAGRLGLSFT